MSIERSGLQKKHAALIGVVAILLIAFALCVFAVDAFPAGLRHELGVAVVTWWHILLGRVILREVLEIPLYALGLCEFWRGFEAATQFTGGRYPWKPLVLGGAALGLPQCVHTIPRGLFIVAVIFGLYLRIFLASMQVTS